MAYDVEFILSSVHAIQKRHGVVSAQPALPAAGRLYVIHNDTTSRPVYVGTASDVQQRFVQRIAAVRELGFGNAHINPIEIHVYRVEVDGRPRPPDDLGYSAGIDVEHLLIRLHLKQGISVRNIGKLGAFVNNTGQRIALTLTAAVGQNVPAYLGGNDIYVGLPKDKVY